MKRNQDILFSIIIPTYNRAHMIGTAIESVLNQTYNNWELIIVDDGSTDNTREVIDKFKDKRIKYFYQENSGESVARNRGIEMSKGGFISFLDDDDYYKDTFLMEFLKFIYNNNIKQGLIVCNIIEKTNNKKIKIPRRFKQNNILGTYWKYNDILINSFVISSNIVKKYRFPEKFYMWEDKYFILSIMLSNKCYYLDKYLSVYTNHKYRSVNKSYGNQYKKDTINRYNALIDFDKKYGKEMLKVINSNIYYHGILKYFYWFSSISMKNYDFKFSLFWLNKIIKFRINYFSVYCIVSILSRIPYYWFKSSINR